jgi:Zn-finger nucleic acid-binding protein
MSATCPRCQTLLSAGDGALLEDVCGRCRGRFLPAEVTERVVVDELGVDRATLKEIAEQFSGQRLACPGCRASMRPLRLHGVLVDLCFSCGGLWLDGGELRTLSRGRHDELGGHTPPVLVVEPASGAVVDTARLGRGSSVVVFREPGAAREAALVEVFAATDALTAIDARLIAANGSCVVVESVSEAGAAALVQRLARAGIAADVVGEEVFRVRSAVTAQAVTLGDELVFSFHTGAPWHVPLSSVLSMTGGLMRRERTAVRTVDVPTWASRTDHRMASAAAAPQTRNEAVLDEVVVVELLFDLAGAGGRRLRLSAPPVSPDVLRALVSRAVQTGVPVGRCAAVVDGGAWPRAGRTRDLERELAWCAWRAARWPVSSSAARW